MRTQIQNAILVIFICAVICFASFGQTPRAVPATDIFLVDLATHNGQIHFGRPRNLTNRKGYDNQPVFFQDGRSLFYTSIRDDNQADIYQYDFAKGSAKQITATVESEYSPTLTPDGKSLSVIRVEADQTQRLWSFPLTGAAPSLILKSIKPVGYHLWVDKNSLLLFILGQPDTLQLVEANSEKALTIIERPGRTLQQIPKQPKVSFVHKISDAEWVIKSIDLKTRQIVPLIKTLAGREFYCWTPDGILLMGNDAKLCKWDAKTDKDWQEIADWSALGIRDITRIAVSPKGDKIAFVAQCTAGC